jgi:hypothetical protein
MRPSRPHYVLFQQGRNNGNDDCHQAAHDGNTRQYGLGPLFVLENAVNQSSQERLLSSATRGKSLQVVNVHLDRLGPVRHSTNDFSVWNSFGSFVNGNLFK